MPPPNCRCVWDRIKYTRRAVVFSMFFLPCCVHIFLEIYIYIFIFHLRGFAYSCKTSVNNHLCKIQKRNTNKNNQNTHNSSCSSCNNNNETKTETENHKTHGKTPSSQSVRQAISLSSLTWASHVGKNGETNEIPMSRFQWVHLKDTFIPASSFSDASTTRPPTRMAEGSNTRTKRKITELKKKMLLLQTSTTDIWHVPETRLHNNISLQNAGWFLCLGLRPHHDPSQHAGNGMLPMLCCLRHMRNVTLT